MSCCGEYQCKQLECNGKLTVDSKINEGVKLSCCGTEDCESVACEGYTVANTPKGEVACCGYADCQNKKCEGQTAVDVNGTLYACCGKENCNQVYEDNKFKTCGKETTTTYIDQSCLSSTNCDCHYVPSDGSGCQTTYYPTDNCKQNGTATSCEMKPHCTTSYYDCKNKAIGPIITMSYPTTGSKQQCSYSCGLKWGCPFVGYGTSRHQKCGYTQTCGQSCTNIPIYDSCAPKNKTQSRYYGQVITTNKSTCNMEKGKFSCIGFYDAHGKYTCTSSYGSCDLR